MMMMSDYIWVDSTDFHVLDIEELVWKSPHAEAYPICKCHGFIPLKKVSAVVQATL